MADKNDGSFPGEDNNLTGDHIDLSSVALVHSSVPPSSSRSRCSYDRNRRVCNLDLSNSPCLRPGSAARDSGYNTDVSPAATISPATNTSRQQHFVFDNICHNQVPELEDRLLTVSHIPPYAVANTSGVSGAQPSFRLHFEERTRSTPPLRLSPDIFRISASPRRIARPSIYTSSRTVSESSDTHRSHYDFDSENEEDSNMPNSGIFGNQLTVPPLRAPGNYEASESFLGLQLPIPGPESEDDGDDDEDVFYRSDLLETWGVASETHTPKCNNANVSLRRRRYCSVDDDDDSLLGACGGSETSNYAHLSPSQPQDHRSFYDPDQEHENEELHYSQKTNSSCDSKKNHIVSDSSSCPPSGQPTSSSQSFQPTLRETPGSRSIPETMFRSDPDDTDSDNDTNLPLFHPKKLLPVPVLQERPLNHQATRSRSRRINVTACLRLSTGHLIPWSSTSDRVSVSTQTPHATSVMIQQILDTPVSLPNEARGTAANLLRRRQSDGAILQPHGSRPLPDIVPPERDRSMSVPDVQTMIRMQRAKEVGRELRRLSDDFHFRILLPSPHEEAGGLFSRINELTSSFTNVITFLRHPFRRPRPYVNGNHSTSVDFVGGGIASISEHPEDLPGD